jgi:multisubunit Na+/H+ antiporter MnhE subunit
MTESSTFAKRLMWVMWPSFLVAAAACGVFFTVFDPRDLHVFGRPVEASREVIYTIGFFLFWAMAIASSALTVFLERSPWEVNR